MKKIYRLLLLALSIAMFSNKTFAQANTKLSNLVAPTSINVTLLPKTASSFNLGSATLPWSGLYTTTLNNSGNATIGGALTMSSFAAGILHSSASGVISSSALTVAQIPSLSSLYLPLSGGTITGSLTGTNGTFSGNATAASFIKTGGTASQMLAANGSVISAGTGITISGGIISNSATGGGGITSLNGLTASSQIFVTATSGTDFSIQSTGTAHIFLMPSSSSASRGLLTSADWITFNSKQSQIILTTNGNCRATFSGNTLNIPVYAGAGNQTITLSGDVTGSGTSAITTALKTITQGAGSSFVKVTLDGNGRVTGNTAVGAADISSALGYTPYNSSNPSGYVTSAALSSYLPLAGGTLTGPLNGTSAVFTSIKAGAVIYPTSAGTANQVLTSDGSGNANWVTPSNAGSGWGLTGNTGTVDGTNFIGTTDNVPLTIKVNNQLAGRIDGSFLNSFFGYQAGLSNTNGGANTAIGSGALYSNTTGNTNTAIGVQALYSNTTGGTNIAIGYETLYSNTIGTSNAAIGINALYANTSGYGNIAIGSYSLANNTTGTYNTANGASALYSNTTGGENTANGYQALYSNTTGTDNTAIGTGALYSSIISNSNTAIGGQALYYNTTGLQNVAIGPSALSSNTTGNNNVANGLFALPNNQSGNNNTGDGFSTLVSNSTGSNLTAIGAFAGVGTDGLTNSTALGYDAVITDNNQIVIGSSGVQHLVCNVSLTVTSDGRYKNNIKQNVPGLEFINQLKPITYTLNTAAIDAKLHSNQKDFKRPDGKTIARPTVDKSSFDESSKIIHTGFIAQDVETAAKKLGYEFSGVDKPKDASKSLYGLRYAEFVVPLVKAVQELSASNDNLKSQNDSLQSQITSLQNQLNEIKTALASIMKDGTTNSEAALSNARLEQNIPNPFSQTTQINYFVPQNAGSAAIKVTDMNGITIKSISINSKGNGRLTLSTAELASGTYTYTLLVDGNIIDTKKMVLMH